MLHWENCQPLFDFFDYFYNLYFNDCTYSFNRIEKQSGSGGRKRPWPPDYLFTWLIPHQKIHKKQKNRPSIVK